MSITLALLSALFASLTTILAKIGIKNVNSNLATAVRTGVVLVMSLIVAWVSGQLGGLLYVSNQAILFLVLSGIATGGSWLFYFKAIQMGDVSRVAPIDKLSVVLTMALSFLILGEPATPLVITGGLIITLGTLLIIGRLKRGEKKSNLYVLFAVISAVLAAVTSILAKIGIDDSIHSNAATFLRTFVILIFAWGIVFATGRQRELPAIGRRDLLFLVLSGIATGASWLCYFGAIELGRVSVVAPIDKLSVILTMILSFLILKEKPKWNTLAGGGLIAAGTVLLIL